MEFTQVKKDELNLLLKELKDDHYLIISTLTSFHHPLGISEFICYFRAQARQVAEVITQFLVQEATDKKLAAFCVVHEVIMRSKDQVSG